MKKSPMKASTENEDAIFESREHLNKEISRFCSGDLYVIGRLWIQALRTVLVGANMSLFPILKAAKPEPVPERPPKMKYKDLPIYESPHYEYKDYVEDKKKCPKLNEKLLQNYLYPKVKSFRRSWADSIAEFNKDAREMKDDACAFACKKQKEFICFLRCPCNCSMRQGVVAAGVVTGFYVGRKGGLVGRLVGASAGALTTGALCFPKETDEVFRDASYKVGKFAVTMFNKVCGMNYVLRERVPCRDDMPPPPAARPADEKNKCEQKKK